MCKIIEDFDCLIFDLDNTLINENTYLQSAYHDICLQFARTDDERDLMYRYFSDEFVMNGRSNLFDKFLVKFKIESKHITEMLDILRKTRVKGGVEILPELRKMLREICLKNRPYFILTNGNVEQQRNKISQINWGKICKPVEVIYANEHRPKPFADSYDYLISRYKFRKPVYIGDSELDLRFAQNASIDFISIWDLKKK